MALAFKLNDNLVHQWRRGRGAPKASSVAAMGAAEAPPRFIELTVPTTVSEMIALEFKRGGVSVTWPIGAAADCAAWLREVLR